MEEPKEHQRDVLRMWPCCGVAGMCGHYKSDDGTITVEATHSVIFELYIIYFNVVTALPRGQRMLKQCGVKWTEEMSGSVVVFIKAN